MSAGRLLRAVTASAEVQGCVVELSLAASRDWASAVFVGARYDVTATLDPGEAAERWLAALPNAELPMPRQFASEVRLVARDEAAGWITVTIEALVLED